MFTRIAKNCLGANEGFAPCQAPEDLLVMRRDLLSIDGQTLPMLAAGDLLSLACRRPTSWRADAEA